MFLLIRGFGDVRKCSVRHFTFHDVSINTIYDSVCAIVYFSFTFHDVSINTPHMSFPPHSTSALHSTMFLLIQHIWSINFASSNFTFHDVSINTIPYASSFSVYCPLHSTMFLLILVAILTAELAMLFTFHDVSINTSFKNSTSSVSLFFTFHDVSINTMSDIVLELSQMGLYIPRCFY